MHPPMPLSPCRLHEENRGREERNGKRLGHKQATKSNPLVSAGNRRRYLRETYIGVCAHRLINFMEGAEERRMTYSKQARGWKQIASPWHNCDRERRKALEVYSMC